MEKKQQSSIDEDKSDTSLKFPEDTKQNLLEEDRNSNTSIPREEGRNEEEYKEPFVVASKNGSRRVYPSFGGKTKGKSKMHNKKSAPESNQSRFASKAPQKKKMVDIDEMLNDSEESNSDDGLNSPSIFGKHPRKNNESQGIKKNLYTIIPDQKQNISPGGPPAPPPRTSINPSGPPPPTGPPPPSKKMGDFSYNMPSKSKKSNIQTKKMRRPDISRKTENFDSNQQQRNFMEEPQVDPFLHIRNVEANDADMNDMDINNLIDNIENPFQRLLSAQGLNTHGTRLGHQKKLANLAQNKENFDDLKYGSSMTFNFSDPLPLKKITTKLRISDKAYAIEMEEDEYTINTVFRILPPSQHIMQDKILNIIEEDEVPPSIEIEYENFISEIDSNTAAFNLALNQPVRFEDTFQLYQDSSKRFLCFCSNRVNEIKRIFRDQYSDSECYYLGFTEYPNDNTHFSFETVAAYQQEENGCVKKHHYVYLTCYDKGKTHYLYNIKKNLVLTESYRSSMSFTILREPSDEQQERTLSRSEVALISFANDNFYLNVPQVIDSGNGKYVEKPMRFERWQDSKSIDFNGWWQINTQEDVSCVTFRNFNTGKYLQFLDLDANPPMALTEDEEKATKFELRSINSGIKDVSSFREREIFKIRVANTDSYVYLNRNKESDQIFNKETNFDMKRLRVGPPTADNTQDAFKIIIPKEEEYLELSVCIDTREYIDEFMKKIMKKEDVHLTLEILKEGLAKVFMKIIDFMTNMLKGKTRVDYSVGSVVPHRQEMVSKVGILEKMFHLLSIINESFVEIESGEIQKLLTISPDDFEGFDSLLEIVIKAIHVACMNNPANLIQCIKNSETIQYFVQIEGCTSLLIDIFKDKSFELNKKEIHSELIYRRIFEFERFENIIKFFCQRAAGLREFNSLMILRKM